tara:strand:- start:498 stop:986 length:489 start_codon:yes stop_codon:yes gene_type:complete
MPATPEELFQRLEALGIETVTHNHPPLRTVEESKALRGAMPGGHHKNLFLRDKKKSSWLVVLPEDKEIDLKTLPARIGAGKLSFGSAERLMEFLGVLPGAVTPFALINDPGQAVQVVLDAGMLEVSPLHYHPLVNTMTTAIAPADLLRFIADCGHRPHIVSL